jgi:glycosyltransferase involved in cell wall biosynthesis
VSHPIQYLVPIYQEISKRHDIEFTAYFYSDSSIGRHFDVDFGTEFEWSTPLLDGYNHRLLSSAKGKPLGKALVWPNWDLLVEVFRRQYDVIWINSYIGANAFLARLAAFFAGTPVFFRDDTNLLTPRPLWKRVVKDMLLRNFLRGTWAFYVGEENRRYWQSYGIPKERLFFSPHCVDNDFWASKARELAPKRNEIRHTFGIIDDAPVILFCGKFIPKKQPLKLLSAFSTVRQAVHCWLLMVGDGHLRTEVEQRVRESGIQGTVLPGFLNQNELPLAYTAADIFVLPSAYNETWGLVVNEAMNFRLPIVVSDQVGCSRDLVKEGWNGYSFAHQDERQLADVLLELVSDPAMRQEFGGNSASLIGEYSIENCATGIIKGGCAASQKLP